MSQFDWPNTPKNETMEAPNIEGSNLKYRDPPLWPPYIPKGGQHFPKKKRKKKACMQSRLSTVQVESEQ
jgi:hypothetical protein